MQQYPARRSVHQAEALAWLKANPAAADTSVITSLPDVSEVPHLAFAAWRAWFVSAATQIIEWLPGDGVAMFFQSDVRHQGCWIDKGYLVMRAAEELGAPVLWHKIVCRLPPGTISQGRSTYSHLIAVARQARRITRPGPDVLTDAGYMPWPRAMGENACRLACQFLRQETATRVVVDPFCGQGSVLAIANAYGYEAVGIDLSSRRCRAARTLTPSEAGK